MKRKNLGFYLLALILLLPVIVNCGTLTPETLNPQQIAEVPYGEPAFPNLGNYWIVDTSNVVSSNAEMQVDAILEQTRAKGHAEQAIVLMTGVTKTVEYTTQLGRHLGLGEADGPNKDNGLIWTLYTDLPSEDVLHSSVGDGLGIVDAADIDEITVAVQPYIDAQDWDNAVLTLATKSAEVLERERGDAPADETPATSPDGERELTPEEQEAAAKVVIAAIVIWTVFCIGVGIVTGDWELALNLWLQVLRLAAALAGAKTSGRSSSKSGSFSGRTR